MGSTATDFSDLIAQMQGPKVAARRFGDVIRAARKSRGMTQREVAQGLDVTSAAVAQWERGFARPGLTTRLDLAQILGIPFDQLLPEAAEERAVVVTDPLLIQIVRRLERLSPEQRQALLTVVLIAASDEPE